MKNKKIFSFPYLLLSFLVLGPLLWFSLVYAQSQTQSGSISIDTAGLTSTATITIKVNGTDNTDPNNPISLSKNLTLTINPAPVSAPLTAPATPTINAVPGSCGSGKIDVTWSGSSGATSFTLKRDSATQLYNGANLNPPPPFSDTEDTGLTPGSSHTYSITASNAAGTSAAATTPSVQAPTACSSIPDLTASDPVPGSTVIGAPTLFTSTIVNGGGNSTGVGFTNLFQTSPVSDGSMGVVDYQVGMSALAGGGNAVAAQELTFANQMKIITVATGER